MATINQFKIILQRAVTLSTTKRDELLNNASGASAQYGISFISNDFAPPQGSSVNDDQRLRSFMTEINLYPMARRVGMSFDTTYSDLWITKMAYALAVCRPKYTGPVFSSNNIPNPLPAASDITGDEIWLQVRDEFVKNFLDMYGINDEELKRIIREKRNAATNAVDYYDHQYLLKRFYGEQWGTYAPVQ